MYQHAPAPTRGATESGDVAATASADPPGDDQGQRDTEDAERAGGEEGDDPPDDVCHDEAAVGHDVREAVSDKPVELGPVLPAAEAVKTR